MKRRSKALAQGGKRRDQVEAGAYDGRYRHRVVQDKRKKGRKEWARKGKNENE